ncbi:hypothetical protein NDU88_006688 [Pleurodeles waltl]|uniref:Uncharacterized protein n=1 Tax=Pleurodeles waltl TaxID=8319 RepID=A0AAV7MDJ7_PLEWA|nr:hypothetical protein NDU88_006688 [Pleurodeles waltl]
MCCSLKDCWERTKRTSVPGGSRLRTCCGVWSARRTRCCRGTSGEARAVRAARAGGAALESLLLPVCRRAFRLLSG